MSMPYYVHEDDAEEYDSLRSELQKISIKEEAFCDENTLPNEHWIETRNRLRLERQRMFEPSYKPLMDKIETLRVHYREIPSKRHEYYIYCSKNGRLPGRFKKPWRFKKDE